MVGLRDRAMILLCFAAALRRSELVALDVADLEEHRRGLLVLLRKSKSDQAGEGPDGGGPRRQAEGARRRHGLAAGSGHHGRPRVPRLRPGKALGRPSVRPPVRPRAQGPVCRRRARPGPDRRSLAAVVASRPRPTTPAPTCGPRRSTCATPSSRRRPATWKPETSSGRTPAGGSSDRARARAAVGYRTPGSEASPVSTGQVQSR